MSETISVRTGTNLEIFPSEVNLSFCLNLKMKRHHLSILSTSLALLYDGLNYESYTIFVSQLIHFYFIEMKGTTQKVER